MADNERFTADNGLHTNQHGGVYANGRRYGVEKKFEVALALKNAAEASGGTPISINAVAKSCKVSWPFTKKVFEELIERGRIVDPRYRPKTKHIRGAGAKSIDEFDAFVLLLLYLEEPSRTCLSYRDWLYHYTGTLVERTVIGRFFLTAFPIRGGLCKPNLVPIDKFRPENLVKAEEYLQFVADVAPTRLKFGDEKLLKGAEIFCRKNRRSVLTGEVPPVLTSSDFRNTYSVTGFCSISGDVSPVRYRIHDNSNDSEEFANDIESALAIGWLRGGDILVLDNAAIHTGRDNSVLEEWLWEEFGIFLLFLPARAPELNPIEQVWKVLVRRLQLFPLALLRQQQAHTVAYAAHEILSRISHDEVYRMYSHCGYLE